MRTVFFAIFLIFICLFSLKGKLEEYKVQKNGELVEVIITSTPSCIGYRTKLPFWFIYDGQKLSKDVGCGFADTHKVGDKIFLKHLEGTDIFLLENESLEGDFLAMVIIGLVSIIGIFCVFKSHSYSSTGKTRLNNSIKPSNKKK